MKYLIALAILYGIYFIFFKKKQVIANKRKKQNESEDTFECATCSTYVSANDAFISSGRYYCSKECMNS